MKTKKILAILIAAVVMFALLPASLFAATTINVTDSVELASAISTANDGDTIYLNNGNYTLPATTIAKNLTITGESESGVEIKASASVAVWITVDATLTLKNLTLDGNTQEIQKAIYVNKDKNLTLENLTMKNIKAPGYEGMGVYNFFGNLTVTNVTMSEIGRIGIHTKSSITVDGFKYTGKGAGDWLDYGIEIGTKGTTDDASYTVNIQNVYISNCGGVATVDSSTSAGILVSTFWYSKNGGSAPFLITANINHANISNCSTGVAIGYNDTLNEFSSTTVSNSNFFGNKYDLRIGGLDATGSLTLSGNYYGGGAPDTDFDSSVTVTGLASYVTTPISMDQNTDVSGDVDDSYIIIIPAKVDFGTLARGTGIKEKAFTVSAENVVIGTGKKINVNVTSNFLMKNGDETLAYVLKNHAGTAITTGNTFAIFSAGTLAQSEAGKVTVDTTNISYSGTYSDIMTFTIDLV